MSLWNSFKIAFSMYSKIWMPKTKWTPENMQYAMCFFPWIGLVIGLIEVIWFFIFTKVSMGILLYATISALIPILISGGIHMDGLMDSADALHSYQEKEGKLAILKDPHTGAFAILYCGIYMVLSIALFTEMKKDMILVLPFIFIISRSLSGFAVATFKMAKDTGLAATFQSASHKRIVARTMLVYLILCTIMMCFLQPLYAVGILVVALLVFAYYKHMAYKQFGGITGDLAGYFLQWAELYMLAILVAMQLLTNVW